MTKKIYPVEEIFHDIPGDPDNVILQLPPELCEQAGWDEGDTIDIKVQDDMIILTKK